MRERARRLNSVCMVENSSLLWVPVPVRVRALGLRAAVLRLCSCRHAMQQYDV